MFADVLPIHADENRCQQYPLSDDWYFEGCTSLLQKQSFVRHLTKLGLTSIFVTCVDDFVAGRSVEAYLPTLGLHRVQRSAGAQLDGGT